MSNVETERPLIDQDLGSMPDDILKKLSDLQRLGIKCYVSNKPSELEDVDVNELSESLEAFRFDNDLSDGDRNLPIIMLRSLGDAFEQRFQCMGQLEDLDAAISALRNGLDLTPENDPSLPDQLSDLGYIFLTRFKQSEELQDITEAIDFYRAATFLTPEKGTLRFKINFYLASALDRRFNYTHELHDVNEAIKIMQDLVDNQDQDDPQFPSTLHNLATFLSSRFELIQDLSDLRRSIDVYRRTIDYRPNDSSTLSNLGTDYQSYFMHTGELPYIQMAIEAQRKALSLVQPDDDNMPAYHLNLAISLETRFLSTENMDDLEEAIQLDLQAIHISKDDDPRVRRYYTNLGNLYYYRSEHTLDLQDMREGARAHREGLLRTPMGHRDLPSLLNNLGNSMRRLYQFTDNEDDLSEAITAFKEGVSIAHDRNVEHMDCLSNLGAALRDKFLRTNQQWDLDDSISALRKAVTLYPHDHPLLPKNLSLLAASLRTLFEEECRLEIMAEAMLVLKWAIDILPEGNAQLPSLFNDLANSFFRRYKITQSNEDIEIAISLYREATQMSAGSPLTRLLSAHQWGSLSLQINLEQSFEAFHTIFNEVIPQLAWIGRTMEQRYTLLSVLSNIVSGAVAVSIRNGQLHTALEWMEQGRSIVWNQVNRFRAPFEDIRSIDLALCNELEKTGIALQEAGMRGGLSQSSLGISVTLNVSVQDEVRRHQGLSKKWDSLLARVRELNGFENFLRPVPFSNLAVNLPSSGFIIVFNCDPSSSDALVISRELSSETCANVTTVQLPLSYERAIILRENLYKILSDPSTRTRTARKGRLATPLNVQFTIKDILRELWYEAVEPVLVRCHLKPTSHPPRIWWCPTGPLAFLPIHAAGDYYSEDKSSNIMEYAISSYIPTITALTQSVSRYHGQQRSQEFKGMLAISEPQAPGLPHIPNTAKEIRAIEGIFYASSHTFNGLEGMEATIKSVSDAMPLHNWIHLSCHALQDDKPLDSAFYLHDGQLTLRDIIKNPLPHAQFAFLSACETGKGDKELSEEAIHLAAGMLTAGYTSVVATMWSISDEYAPRIAKEFYTYILKKEGKNPNSNRFPDCTRAAAALHHTIGSFRQLTGDDEENLLLWVPYVHVGI